VRLVEACLAGDESAWEELWLRFGPVVKAVARRAGCSDDEADEVLQRVALAALDGLPALREREKLPGWLAAVARHQAFAVLRSRSPSADLFEHALVEEPDPAGDLARDEELLVLREALARLEPRCRRIIERLYLKEPPDSYAQVAADEGLATTSVGPIRGRCLKRLRCLVEGLSRSARSEHLKGEGR
jgi:RNA polymerase sigma factor (sigma-70 family)